MNNHGDDLQQLALLSYLKSEDKGRPFLEAVTAAKVSEILISNAIIVGQGYLNLFATREKRCKKQYI